MSRVIKFRAWIDGEHKGAGNWPTLRAKKLMEYGVNLSTEGHYPTVPLMQFTGLLDKNGKEIYEGDIVRCASNRACPHEVVWMQEIPSTNIGGASGFYLKGLNEGYAFGGEEVIGNIYENPELLKV